MISSVLADGRSRLGDMADADLDSELLLAHVLGRSRSLLLASPNEPIDQRSQLKYERLIERRAAGEPLAYLIGYVDFCGVRVEVTPDVLVPRHETELLVDWALSRLRCRGHPEPKILDVGTGSGAVALAVASAFPSAVVHASEVSEAAASVAATNVASLGLAQRVSVHVADIVPPGTDSFDLVLANLPYVGTRDTDLAPEVRRFEPAAALFAGPDGLAGIRRLLELIPERVRPGADIGIEIGWRQGGAVRELAFDSFPDGRVTLRQDIAGLDRLVTIESV
jgi:release factor glutamine methyltransferase